ncbi:MAG: outer membrane protein assembly factor BamD [Deltaproteobacteria bacterium]|nr:outer membrane protein assembly factor BamD [Deltaproteobacteria bacterium]
MNFHKIPVSKGIQTHGLWLKGVFFALLAVVLIGCAGQKETMGQRDPKELYDAAVSAYVGERYEEAETAFKKLMEDYPLSRYSTEAQLMLGDVYYSTEKYDDAGSYYTNFAALHPSHPKAPYALFQKGMSHFKDVLSVDRDQTSTKKALFAFEDLTAIYPDSAYTVKARELKVFLKNRLAEREFYVARFYYKSKNYKGALGRFRDILKNFPDTDFIDTSLYYIGESYIKLGEKKLAEEAYSTLISNFPNSPFLQGAKDRLKES